MLLTFVLAFFGLTTALPQQAGKGIGVAIPMIKHSQSRLNGTDGLVDFNAVDAHTAFIKSKISRRSKKFTSKRQTQNRVPLADFGGDLRYGYIFVGSDPYPFTVVFDTGISDLFLPASTCRSCKDHTLWDPKNAKNLDRPFQLGDQPKDIVSGSLYADSVTLGGFTAFGQTIGAASTYPEEYQFSNFPADGVMGMGFESASMYPASPFFQTLLDTGALINPVFSFKLSSSGGELFVGGANSALYTGQITYIPVMKESGYWRVNMDSILGNGRAILVGIPCVIDTGANFIFGAPSQVSQLHEELGGRPEDSDEGYYSFSCDAMPTITLSFAGELFTIPAKNFNLGRLSDDSPDCRSGIVSQDLPEDVWLIGGIFLESVYATFDFGTLQIGFARLA